MMPREEYEEKRAYHRIREDRYDKLWHATGKIGDVVFIISSPLTMLLLMVVITLILLSKTGLGGGVHLLVDFALAFFIGIIFYFSAMFLLTAMLSLHEIMGSKYALHHDKVDELDLMYEGIVPEAQAPVDPVEPYNKA